MKYLILGAGPAGLAFGNALYAMGEKDFLILEHEAEAGGLCRTKEVDGAPLDIGGGHFLDVIRPHINEFLFRFMPQEEWNKFERDSRISINGNLINHPIEANIWQMKLEDQVEYLKSIAVAGCNLNEDMPQEFVKWIFWKLGDRIAKDYMIPYNQKMFGENLDLLGTYWLEKLPNVSFEETLMSCLTQCAYGTQPAHAQFYYPKKYGYGEVWLRMADTVKSNILYNCSVNGIDFNTKTVSIKNGGKFAADIIITTIPWQEFDELVGMPEEIKTSIGKLKHSSIQTEYFAENLESEAHWIYYPNTELSYHRILVRHNFCLGSRGYWTETNGDRVDEFTKSTYKYLNKYAYPLNTLGKPGIMRQLLNWCEEKKVYGLGRWGEHQHYNSDVTVERALKLAEILCKG